MFEKESVCWLDQQLNAERMQVRKFADLAKAAKDERLKRNFEENHARHIARCVLLDARLHS